MLHTERNDALLIVNVQNGFLNAHTSHIPARVEFLASWFDTVIISQYYNSQTSSEDDILSSLVDWAEIAPGSIEFDHAFDIPKNGIIISKPSYSVITPDLLKIFDERDIKRVHLAGMDTDISIRICARDLLAAGHEVRVHGSYCASTLGPWRHRSALRKMSDILVEADQGSSKTTIGRARRASSASFRSNYFE